MQIEEKIRNKFEALISSAQLLGRRNEHGQVLNENQRQNCVGWLASAQNMVHFVIKSSSNPYRSTVDKICAMHSGLVVNQSVGEVRVILQSLLQDIDAGFLVSIEEQTRGAVFDDFLEHAKSYLGQKRPKEAGVIAGVVFEDTLRSICRSVGINEKGEKLDSLINCLVKADKLSPMKAKRARVAAHVRTKATHAQWDEFDLADVRTTVELTEELILKFLDQ